MAHKLLAPFKQLPLFKRSSEKWKDLSLSNYNAIYGMLDDVTCLCFDEHLHIFAIGTKAGEIKIYGSSGVLYTLIGSPLKPVHMLKFLDGQGRLLSVTSENEILLWEFKIELSNWEVTSTLSINSLEPNASILTIDVSHQLSWKSDDDNLLQLLMVGISGNKFRQVLIVGNRFHVYDGDDLSLDNEVILSRCPDLSKEYEFGEIISIKFNLTKKEKFFVAFSNGLILLMNVNLTESKSPNKEELIVRESVETEIEHINTTENTEKNESNEQQNGSSSNDKLNVKADDSADNIEVEKNIVADDTQKSEEIKVEVKKLKESIQVPFVHVKIPSILNYLLNDKKISNVCWSNDDIAVNYQESDEIYLYHTSEVDFKLIEPAKIVSIQGDQSPCNSISYLSHFSRNKKDVLAFVTTTEDHQNALSLVIDNHIDAQFITSSKIIDYCIVTDGIKDDDCNRHVSTLLILCESQLIAIDLTSEEYTELCCPYLVLRTTSQITAVTNIVQVPSVLFSNLKPVDDLFQDWPIHTPLTTHERVNDEIVDILATGHLDGTINIWQVMSTGVLSLLESVTNDQWLKNVPKFSNPHTDMHAPRRYVGHNLIKSDENVLKINNIQLIYNGSETLNDATVNTLFCVSGNSCGNVFVFKYDRSEVGGSLVEIISNLKDCNEKEDIVWNDSEAPEFLTSSIISSNISKLSHIIKLNPSLPVTAIDLQPQWNMLAIGCTYGVVLIDLKENATIFSYSTLNRASKTSIASAPLTVGQQLRKSMRQSFKKLKKLKPSSKHAYTVNEDKPKEKSKEEVKSDESKTEDQSHVLKEGDQSSEQAVTIPEKAELESKEKIDELEECAVVTANEAVVEGHIAENEPPIEISRKDKPPGTVGSLLFVATNLTSSVKEPCLFVGTNMGAIYAFEVNFDLEGPVSVKLSKELHLQHKAPVLLMAIVNSNHIPLVCTNEVFSYQRKCSIAEEKVDEVVHDVPVTDVDNEVGHTGDSEDRQAKLKAGTLPAPQKTLEDDIEKTELSRKSVDAGKDKIISSSTSMKKSGTLPASFLQAIGKSSGNSDAHELLVVSEEQVKLFSLPSLKAKYKYKVVDTGHHYGHTKANSNQESETNLQEKKVENIESNNAELQTPKKQIRRILSVGLCKINGQKQLTNKWGVSIALTNGEIIALTMNSLKKYLSNLYNSNPPILANISNGEMNLVVSISNHNNIQITDFSLTGVHHYEPLKSILIPVTARPIVKIDEKVDLSVKVDKAEDEVKSDNDKVEEVLINGDKPEHMNGHAEINEVEEEKDQLGDETVVQNPSTTHHGDITMDSIKEYITNMDGNITVKTFESSTEKHITVNDGQIVTTIHEKQIKDGDVIKDETMKITSDTIGSNSISLNE